MLHMCEAKSENANANVGSEQPVMYIEKYLLNSRILNALTV